LLCNFSRGEYISFSGIAGFLAAFCPNVTNERLSLIVCCTRAKKQDLMSQLFMMSTDIKNRFGTAVRSRRKRLGISQEELAGRAGLHRTYVADIERGARNLSLANIEKLARALETSIPTLFTPDESHGKPDASKPREILLVEDNPADAELTVRAFRSARVANPVRVARFSNGNPNRCRLSFCWISICPG
jgi:transcriptional regulator with XRE-family HTH domain